VLTKSLVSCEAGMVEKCLGHSSGGQLNGWASCDPAHGGRLFARCMTQGKSFNGLEPMSVEVGTIVVKGFQ